MMKSDEYRQQLEDVRDYALKQLKIIARGSMTISGGNAQVEACEALLRFYEGEVYFNKKS